MHYHCASAAAHGSIQSNIVSKVSKSSVDQFDFLAFKTASTSWKVGTYEQFIPEVATSTQLPEILRLATKLRPIRLSQIFAYVIVAVQATYVY